MGAMLILYNGGRYMGLWGDIGNIDLLSLNTYTYFYYLVAAP